MYQATNVYVICGFAAIGKSSAFYCENIALTAFTGGGLFGFDISSMSGVLGTMAYKRYFGYPKSYGQGAITASMPFGSLFGALISSYIADRFSRRTCIQVGSIFWIIGSM